MLEGWNKKNSQPVKRSGVYSGSSDHGTYDLKMPDKLKLLYLSSIKTESTYSGFLLMYRHLKERSDFDLLEYGDIDFAKDGESSFYYKIFSWVKIKVDRTFLYPAFLNIEWLFQSLVITKSLNNIIKNFKPDIILTVAHGPLFWLAYKVSKKFQIPLVTIFHDWWPEFSCQPAFARWHLDKRVRLIHQQSRVSLPVCKGMKVELGPHPDCRILYPIPGEIKSPEQLSHSPEAKKVWRMIYTGNTCAAYGKKLMSLINKLYNQNAITLTIFTGNCDWPREVQDQARTNGILKDFIRNDELLLELKKYDAFLVVMGGEQKEIVRKTSFPCKTVDYLQSGRPIVAWGPSDSSVCQFIHENDCGLLVHDNDPTILIQKVISFMDSPERQEEVIANAGRIYDDLLSPEIVQEVFVRAISDAAGIKS